MRQPRRQQHRVYDGDQTATRYQIVSGAPSETGGPAGVKIRNGFNWSGFAPHKRGRLW